MKSQDKRTMLEMLDVIPTLKEVPGFQGLVEGLPDDLDFATLDKQFEADLEAMQEEERNPDYWNWTRNPPSAAGTMASDRPSAPTNPTKSRPITIRIPGSILRELRVAARAKGIGYQTLLIRMLKGSLAGS